MLLYEALLAFDEADDADAVDGDREGVNDFEEFNDVEEAAEEWQICAELHLEGKDFSWPIVWNPGIKKRGGQLETEPVSSIYNQSISDLLRQIEM